MSAKRPSVFVKKTRMGTAPPLYPFWVGKETATIGDPGMIRIIRLLSPVGKKPCTPLVDDALHRYPSLSWKKAEIMGAVSVSMATAAIAVLRSGADPSRA